MNTKRKLIFSILMIFVLCLSASAIYAAEDDDANIAESQDDNIKIAESQDFDAISASDVENIETETVDNDVGELSSPAESEILSEDKIDTSTAKVEVRNGTIHKNGVVLLIFSEMYDYNSIYSENTYIRINEETVFGQVYYNDLGESSTYFFNMPELDMGDYPFTIHYDGNDYYEANDFEGTYHVTKTPLIVNIFPNSVKEGENGTIDVSIWEYEPDIVDYGDGDNYLHYEVHDAIIIVNNKEYKLNISSEYSDVGLGTVTLDILPAGNYDVSFKFTGDENYMVVEEFVADKQFSVISKDNKANIKDLDITVKNAFAGHNGTISYGIYDKVGDIEMNGNLKIILVDENENEYEYLADVDEDGEGSIDLGWNLTGGTYILKVQYMGNDYYNPSELITANDWDEIPIQLTIYDENNKKSFYNIYSYYVQNILKGENTTFNISMDEYYQISDIPYTGKVKIILTNYYDEDEIIEYIVALDKNGEGTIDLGYNLTGNNYIVSIDYIDDPVYSYDEEDSIGSLEIISKENKAQIGEYAISTDIQSAFKNNNGTITINFTDAKRENIPLDGNVTIKLSYYDWENENREDFEYLLNIINDAATVNLGYNYNYNEYAIYLTELNTTYYRIDDEGYHLGTFYIYDEDHKAPVKDIDCEFNNTIEGRNATIAIDMSNSKISDMPLTGNMKLILSDSDENEYEYIIAIDENGKCTIDIGYNLTYGSYSLRVFYLGNDYYKESDYDLYFDYLNIYGGDYKVEIGHAINYSFDNITKGKNATITFDLSPYQVSGASMAGTINVTLINSDSREEYYYLNDYVVDDSGKCIVKLGDNLPLGQYLFQLSYSGNNVYEADEFIVYKKVHSEDGWDWEDDYIYVVAPAATILTASNVNINANPNSGYFKVTLKSNGAALAGQNVTITFNGKTYKATTDKNGVATFKLSSGVAKKYPVTISFAGSDKYLSSTAKAYVTIKKNNVKFSKATKKVKKSKAKKAKFKITLKTSNNKVLAKKLVYIKINKKTYKAKTNAKGVATFKLKLPKKKKTYKYKVTFKGDKANNKKTFSKKLTVK